MKHELSTCSLQLQHPESHQQNNPNQRCLTNSTGAHRQRKHSNSSALRETLKFVSLELKVVSSQGSAPPVPRMQWHSSSWVEQGCSPARTCLVGASFLEEPGDAKGTISHSCHQSPAHSSGDPELRFLCQGAPEDSLLSPNTVSSNDCNILCGTPCGTQLFLP